MENKECAICFEHIGHTNNCVTPCGHEFCFKCMVKSYQINDTCPMCRSTYLEKDECLEDSYTIESDSEDEYDDETIYVDTAANMINITEKTPIANPQSISKVLIENGYTMEDIISLWTSRINRENTRYTQKFIRKMDTDIDKLIQDADIEQEKRVYECQLMASEENNRQMEVVENNALEGVRLMFGR